MYCVKLLKSTTLLIEAYILCTLSANHLQGLCSVISFQSTLRGGTISKKSLKFLL